MVTISYEDGVFRITDLSLILEKLYYYLNQQKNSKESSPDISKIVIDPNVFKLVVFDLIKEKKGIKAFCKECDRDYFPDQISIEKMGTYADPQPAKEKWNIWRWMKGLFERKKLEMKIGRIGRFGGERMLDPHGHELLTIVRWIS